MYKQLQNYRKLIWSFPKLCFIKRRNQTLTTGLRFMDLTYNYNRSDYNKRFYSSSSYDLLLKQPKYFNLIADVLDPIVDVESDKTPLQNKKTALWITDGKKDYKYSYLRLCAESQYLSYALRDSIEYSEPRCALVLLPKTCDWWIANIAASWTEMVISPGTVLLTEHDIKLRLEKSKADCIICTADIAFKINHFVPSTIWRIYNGESIMELEKDGWTNFDNLINSAELHCPLIPMKTTSDQVCQLFFTSGTTGAPKMVPHTQGSYGVGHQVTSKFWLDLNDTDVVWNMSDTGWAKTAWSSLYAPFLAGATAYVHQMQKFDPLEVIKSLVKDEVSVLCAPPTVYRALVQCDLSEVTFKSLRHCVSAGEPLNPEVMEEWKRHTGLDIYEGYGQTETTLLCATFPGMTIKPGSMGMAAPGYDIKILDDNYNELGVNKVGHMAVSLKSGWPTGLFKGYLDEEELNKKVFVGDYYLTGDKAYMDEDQYFWFVARSDDVINSAGYRIGPFEVESALLEHKAVAESAVVASPDSLRGEVVKAYIVLTDAYQGTKDEESLKKELQDYVKRVTAPYKYPRKIVFVDSLPKTVSGKIKRAELRKLEDN